MERRDAKTRECILSEPPFTCLGLANYDGPRWLGGWGDSGEEIDTVSLGHGDPLSAHVRVTTATRPLECLLEELEDGGAQPAGSVEMVIEGVSVTLQRWLVEGLTVAVAVGAWREGAVEVETSGVGLALPVPGRG